MLKVMRQLFWKRSAWPELFELTACTRNSSWSLRWQNAHLMSRQILPPIEIFPTAGARVDEKRITIITSTEQWQNFWKAVANCGAAEWVGNYSWTDKVKVLGGQHCTLALRKGDVQVNCEGGCTLDTAPPEFLKLLDVIVSLVGEDKHGPVWMAKVLREQENNSTVIRGHDFNQ